MRKRETIFLIPLRTLSRIHTRRPTWYPSKYIRPCRCDDEETMATKDDAPDERETKMGGEGEREGERSRARKSNKSRRVSLSRVSWSSHPRSGKPARFRCARKRKREREKRGCGRRIRRRGPSSLVATTLRSRCTTLPPRAVRDPDDKS